MNVGKKYSLGFKFIINNKVVKNKISGLITVAIDRNTEKYIFLCLKYNASKMERSESVSDIPYKYKVRKLSETRNTAIKNKNI